MSGNNIYNLDDYVLNFDEITDEIQIKHNFNET